MKTSSANDGNQLYFTSARVYDGLRWMKIRKKREKRKCIWKIISTIFKLSECIFNSVSFQFSFALWTTRRRFTHLGLFTFYDRNYTLCLNKKNKSIWNRRNWMMSWWMLMFDESVQGVQGERCSWVKFNFEITNSLK